jgi:hypothetical protein
MRARVCLVVFLLLPDSGVPNFISFLFDAEFCFNTMHHEILDDWCCICFRMPVFAKFDHSAHVLSRTACL